MTEKLHWFAFSFIHADGVNPKISRGHTYVGFQSMLMTTGKIAYAKEMAQLPCNSVLLAFSYMGEATREEITEDYPTKEKV